MQVESLKAAGSDKIYEKIASGAKAVRSLLDLDFYLTYICFSGTPRHEA